MVREFDSLPRHIDAITEAFINAVVLFARALCWPFETLARSRSSSD